MRRAWIVIAIFTGCAGKAPKETVDAPGSPPDAAIDTSQTLSGTAIDYFSAAALPGTSVASDGIAPQVTATAAADGTYMLAVPVGSKLFLVASHASYRDTRSVPLVTNDTAVMQDVYAMSTADVTRQYTTLGKSPTASKAFLIADLRMHDGTAVTGIPLANVSLLDSQNQRVAGVIGPYFIGSVGDVDMTVTTATVYGTPARSRVALLDVPPGNYTLSVTYPTGMTTTTDQTPVTVAADAATLAVSGLLTIPLGGGVTDPHFASDIWPHLQKAAAGGLGCANCHTASGPAAVLPFDDPAPTVLTHMQAITGVIDTTTPASSLLLVRPLYEQPPTPQDHPNATFLDTNDPYYKLFLLWITNGAKP
jgi:hypothetical protein